MRRAIPIGPLLLAILAVLFSATPAPAFKAARDAQASGGEQPAPQAPPIPSAPQAPQAQRRTALVIGNAAYAAAPLKNPVNDARDMAATLRSLGFDVILRENASLPQMEGAVNEFWQRLRQGGAGLFYFAGHGLQVNGRNYLVPVGARVEAEQDAKYRCMDAGLVLGRMENAGNGLNIVILDACRNNPFARSWRSADVGLAKMDAPKGSLIAYATAPDSVAADGQGKNGLYTEKLLRAMRAPGQPVEQMFKRVRDEVMRATGDKQVPWESTSLRGDFSFSPGAGAVAPALPAPAPPASTQLAMAERPQQAPPPANPAGQATAYAAQFAQLARAGLPEAQSYFENAVRTGDNDARAGLSIALFFAGRDTDARYHAQRLHESGAQTPATRLLSGLVLGLEGSADAAYQQNRAQEEGMDRALVLLCQAFVAARRKDYAEGQKFMDDYAALVAEPERGEFAARLAAQLDLKRLLAGRYTYAWSDGTLTDNFIDFAVQGGKLTATPGGGNNTSGIWPSGIDGLELKGSVLTFRFHHVLGLFNLGKKRVFNFTCDLAKGLDTILCSVTSGDEPGVFNKKLIRMGAR